MKKFQILSVLIFAASSMNVFASNYEKPENARRASRTERNTPEQPKAKKKYLDEAKIRKLAEDKVKAPKASSQAK